ncbi:hypothetical protein CALCODRAFT_47047 [Calocera cornea HHB12733]|uniref:Uncharacterized protein n=1 Tax=Calocera cornea HHB12733 TaxID=1353952 RepID=A0A165J0C1_9BASI|nr:hypothetical protein CALCODRAFT_47047 [Calocera cornea HHB12733]
MSATLSPTKAQILQSSQAGWSPLRIQKRSPSPTKLSPIPGSPQPAHADPASAPAAAAAAPPAAVNRDGSRRTSSSFSHLRQHSLVSNSPFKSPDAAHAPSGARYKPRPQSAYGYVLKPSDPARDGNERGKLGRAGKVPSGLGISGAGLSPMLNEGPSPDPPAVAATQRKSSAQRRQSEPENEDPRLPPAPALSLSPGASAKAAAFKPRKSRGLQELTHAHYVSRSPFLPDGDPASPRRLAEDGMGRSASLGSLMEENLDLRRGEEEEEGPPVPRKEHPVLPTPESELGLQLHEELPQPQRSAATTVLATATATATATTTTTTTATTTAQTVQFQLEKASPTPSPAQHAKHHPSLNASPRRPALTSYRLHGPRTNSSGPLGPGQRRVSSNSSRRRRRRNKKVTFDERCDVVEFEREESAAEEDEEGEWTEGTEGTEGEGSDLEGTGTGANSEAEVDGVLREEEWEEEEEGRLRVVNADEADEHEHEGEGEEHEGLHGLVSQLVASPAPGAAASPAQLPHPQYAQHDPSHLAPHGHPSGPGFAPHPRPRETSIDRIERDVESILRDADLLMPAGELAQDSEEAEADRSAVSQGTVEIHGSPRFAPAEHSFIHSQSMAAPPDLSTITPDTPGIPFSPDTSYASGAPSTPPRKSAGDYHNHTPATPSTPPNRSPLPRELAEDAEDGVPLGRTHHAARHGEAYRPLHAGLLPTPVLPDMAPNSPFVFSPSIAQGTPAQPHSPRITREEVRARLALSRFGTPRTRARQGTPTSPGTGTGAAKAGSGTPDPSASVSPAPTSTTAHSSQSTPVPNMFARGGPESPVPVEHAAPHGAREVEVFHPSSSSSSGQGTPGRMDKALPAPPGSGEGRPELKSAEGGSVLGVRSGLERLVEGVRQHASPAAVVGTASPAGSPSPGKTRRVPVPSFAVDSGSPTKRLATEEEAEMERTDSIEQREREVVAMRRERRERGRGFGLGEDEEESVDSPKRLEPPQRRTGRRRSLSMGDVEEDPKAEERELETKQSMLLPTPEIAGDVFSDSVEREVRKYIDGPVSCLLLLCSVVVQGC